jgi:hypothetical protein
MTRSFFRNLEQNGVAYLLISGQATVLYQAAEFSEDLDLWIEPSNANIERLIIALRAANARFYKLTPPLTEQNFRAGHGFHFVFEGEQPFYLDVMGKPPRVGSFQFCAERRQTFETDWGTLPVIGLKDLVEIKKTQRLRDYSIISALARRWIDRPEFSHNPDEYRWILENIFSLADLEELAQEQPSIAQWSSGDTKQFLENVAQRQTPTAELEDRLQNAFQSTIGALQRADRDYWKPIISQLRVFKAKGELVPEGNLL